MQYSALALWAAGTMNSAAAAAFCRYCLWSCLPHPSLGPVALPGWFSLPLALAGVRSLYLLHPDLWPEPGPCTPAAGPQPLAKVAGFYLSMRGVLEPMHGYLIAEEWIRKLNTRCQSAPPPSTGPVYRDVAVFQVGMGKPERYIFFLDTSPQNKRRVGQSSCISQGPGKNSMDGMLKKGAWFKRV